MLQEPPGGAPSGGVGSDGMVDCPGPTHPGHLQPHWRVLTGNSGVQVECRAWGVLPCSRVPGPTRAGTPLLPGSACRLASLQGGREPQEVLSCRRAFLRPWPPCGSTLKSLWFEEGCYLARELVCLHEFYLKVTEKLKIEEFWLGRGQGCSVALATTGSALLPTRATAGQVGQGTAHAGRSPSLPCPLPGPGPAACPLLSWYKLPLAQGGLGAPRQ